MNKHTVWIFFACTLLISLVFSFFPMTGYAQQSEEENTCAVCHSEKGEEYAPSIHAKRGITCVDCHGGDNTILSRAAMAPSAGFKPKPSKAQIPALCASCHSDVKMMTPYGLPTDQFDHYKISIHGIRLFEKGDSNVAVCTDCHGTHGILDHKNPNSPVYVTNVPQMCDKCHGDPKIMGKYNIPTDQYEKYKKSVHGVSLLENQNLSAPNCARCHGTHGAAPPGVADISKVCGQCHTNTRNYFNQSEHKQAMDMGKISECVSCHGNHDITKPDITLFDTSCIKCHPKDSEAFIRGQKIKSLLVNTQAELDDARKIVQNAKHSGVFTEEYELQLEEGKTNIIQVIPVLHTLSINAIDEYVRNAQRVAGDVKLAVHSYFESLKIRKLGLGFLWLFIAGVSTALYLRKRRADRELHEE